MVPEHIPALLEELRSDSERHGHTTTAAFHGRPEVTVRPAAFKRCLNLILHHLFHGKNLQHNLL